MLILGLLMGPSMAEDRNKDPKFIQAMLTDCYTRPERLVEYNKKNFGKDENEAKMYVEFLCGKLIMRAKDYGVGLIILNIYESENSKTKL